MHTLDQLRDRGVEQFTRLLDTQQPQPDSDAPRESRFSWFVAADATDAALIALRLTAAAAGARTDVDGLAAALDVVADESATADAELLRQGFAMFVTHTERGRMLAKPRTVSAAPGLFTPPTTDAHGPAISIGGLAPGLDYWREDVLANEHHQHWHEVYPYTGRPPVSFAQVVTDVSDADKATLLEVMDPRGDWLARIAAADAAAQACFFTDALAAGGRAALTNAFFDQTVPRALYRKILPLNDRHGELFTYMHRQMLARYDAELASHGLDRVRAFGPDQWRHPIPEGYDPEHLAFRGLPFTTRGVDRTIDASAPPAGTSDLDVLLALQQEVDAVLADGVVPGADSSEPDRPVAADSLGEFVEERLHNTGHGVISGLSDPDPATPNDPRSRRGVMGNPVAAIRDQVFWRWHKHIDDLAARWQDTLAPETFDDLPPVLIRNGLADGAPPWSSPDILLLRTSDLTGVPEADRAATVAAAFGGDHWDDDGSAPSARPPFAPLDELVTFTETAPIAPNRDVEFLTHEPFHWVLRIAHTGTAATTVTARIFLAPSAFADDRHTWIEMDKFTVALAAGQRAVVLRADTDSSVVKKPVDTSPRQAQHAPPSTSYCDCGWPYPLLLPRGTADGLECRILVLLTDAAADSVDEPGRCGSMSFCGARDRYPDRREMGYPFARPFPAGRTPADVLLSMAAVAGRTVRIRHR